MAHRAETDNAMSHYTVMQTALGDIETLVEALADMGFAVVETHAKPQALVGYRGDQRDERAEVIVRRRFLGSVSNDIGFARNPDGTLRAIISDFDRKTYDTVWLGKLTQRYAYRVARKTLAAQDFDLVEEHVDDQRRIHLTVRRMA